MMMMVVVVVKINESNILDNLTGRQLGRPTRMGEYCEVSGCGRDSSGYDRIHWRTLVGKVMGRLVL